MPDYYSGRFEHIGIEKLSVPYLEVTSFQRISSITVLTTVKNKCTLSGIRTVYFVCRYSPAIYCNWTWSF